MLKKLRRDLTVLCTVITGLILVAMASFSFLTARTQSKKAEEAAFENSLSFMAYKLQGDNRISGTWLTQMESGGYLIHVEDNGSPLLFRGVWDAPTARETLVEGVRKTASERYGISLSTPPISQENLRQEVFQHYGNAGERYLAGVSVISVPGGWRSLIVLEDMGPKDAESQRQFWLFAGAAVLSILLLLGFSWWFSGRAIRPVEESARRQSEFVAAASHELRSPLAVVRACVGAMHADPEHHSDYETKIDSECVRMARLVDDLLLLASVDAKTWSIRLAPLEPDTLLLDLLETYQPLARKKKQRLSLHLPEDGLPRVNADGQRLCQLLGILLDNALAYTPEGGALILRAECGARTVRLEVEDNGPGIAPEAAPHIFERFYRADASRHDKSHFGLGLSIANELARLHGGTLSLRAASPHGCVFRLELPRG